MAQELTSTEAAELVGCSVQTWHRHAAEHHVEPARQGAGIRGARWWRLVDVQKIARKVAS